MNNTINRQRLKELLLEAETRDMNQLTSGYEEYEGEIPVSVEAVFEQIRRKTKKKYVFFANRRFRRIAVFLFASFFAGTAAVMSVDALRVPFVKFVEEKLPLRSILKMQDEYGTVPERIEEHYEPGWVPDGYEQLLEENTQLFFAKVYFNQEGERLFFEQNLAKNYLEINTEGVTTEIVKVGEYDGITYRNLNETSLIWNDSKYTYKLVGDFTLDELVEIALSVKIQEEE